MAQCLKLCNEAVFGRIHKDYLHSNPMGLVTDSVQSRKAAWYVMSLTHGRHPPLGAEGVQQPKR